MSVVKKILEVQVRKPRILFYWDAFKFMKEID